ncbi:hypothetical protein JCM19275_2788 [Nonlabens ulvanivorans]|uniref:Uncharacterized protein n=1 Tax=Nonlabens ulvanivorans TaxID=906888 RepID=A0A090WAF6_NONUL|nr:hypothetical protein JCM19275_2788 [Nonlabens ulvanivorans]
MSNNLFFNLLSLLSASKLLVKDGMISSINGTIVKTINGGVIYNADPL